MNKRQAKKKNSNKKTIPVAQTNPEMDLKGIIEKYARKRNIEVTFVQKEEA